MMLYMADTIMFSAQVIFSIIFPILAALGTIAFFIGIPFCIYFAIKAYNEPNKEQRMRIVKKALWIFFGPILLVFLTTLVQGLMAIFSAAF